jgi:methionyl-tRNA synthetase
MDGAQSVNAYLNAEEPWKLLKTDRGRAATVLWTALQAISGLRVALTPYLPFTSDRLGEILGLDPVSTWERPELVGESGLGEVRPLFTKLEADALDE